jgi:hypothetical protein
MDWACVIHQGFEVLGFAGGGQDYEPANTVGQLFSFLYIGHGLLNYCQSFA